MIAFSIPTSIPVKAHVRHVKKFKIWENLIKQKKATGTVALAALYRVELSLLTRESVNDGLIPTLKIAEGKDDGNRDDTEDGRDTHERDGGAGVAVCL